jgi:hypothetical protein
MKNLWVIAFVLLASPVQAMQLDDQPVVSLQTFSVSSKVRGFFSELSAAAEEHSTLLRFHYLDSEALDQSKVSSLPSSCERVSAATVSSWVRMIADGLLDSGCGASCRESVAAFSTLLGSQDLDRCVFLGTEPYSMWEVIEYRSLEGDPLFGFEIAIAD